MKKYPGYINSGADWLGRVPSHWKLGRLGSYVSLRGEKGSDKVFEPLSVTKNGVVAQLETAAKTDDGENRKVVRKGDIAINGRSDRKGSSGLSEMDGSVSLINIVLKIDRGLHPKFAHHLIRSVAFQEEFYRWGRGIVADLWSTNYWDLKRIPTAIPPIEEQEAIASFIDATLADMDSAIASQERMIELLKERRSAIITQAVTKGLDPKAKTKDSGIPWLGQVPAHWEVRPLKALLDIKNGKDHKEIESDLGVPVFGSGGQFAFAQAALFDGETVMLGRKGTIDRPLHYRGKFWVVDTMYWSHIKSGAYGRYVYYACKTITFSLYTTNTALPSITKRDLGSHRLCVPSREEQMQIASYLDMEVGKIESAILSQEKLIEILKERRSAIITQAVTGQIDVR